MISVSNATGRTRRTRWTGRAPVVRGTRGALAAAVAAGVLAAVAGGTASAAPRDAQPQAVPGKVIKGGADGHPHTVMCPPEESALSGGFAVSAPRGRQLSGTPSDLLESRPTADATGWTIAVRKDLAPNAGHGHGHSRGRYHRADTTPDPADLTVYLVCTQGENTPGG